MFIFFDTQRNLGFDMVWHKLQRSKSHETFKSQFCSRWWNERRLKRLFQSHVGLFVNFPLVFFSLLRRRWCRHVRGEGKICVRYRSHCASRSIEDLATRCRRVILYSSGPRLFWGRAWGAQYGYASSAPQRSLLAAQLRTVVADVILQAPERNMSHEKNILTFTCW